MTVANVQMWELRTKLNTKTRGNENSEDLKSQTDLGKYTPILLEDNKMRFLSFLALMVFFVRVPKNKLTHNCNSTAHLRFVSLIKSLKNNFFQKCIPRLTDMF